ncbi:MAG: 30S ribosomal protein S6 [Candidatus Eisenbacteria bacterium]|uniref:Small ribosomal subunit protein bS6 n=1 Tax=Eiseniibacteriota bacterium TaxID=2212470 RepID=A0A948RUD7_UNCEI|nr:30S ribosomal protein S6 [Candidatus Eisenbacteria bacterium]MBU1950659.1 30S ribosomal protein S6 [Candidatus Eisenbacteria bacterium]MBU2689642.1 30S ribosomal protein S6 [Candidatus Eisenbacteria bacterium]
MKDYETVFVLHPRLDDAKVEEEIQKVKDIITQADGQILDVQKWGRKRLAYEIQKIHEGLYTVIQYSGEPQTVKDLDRRYKLNENVLRYLTVVAHPKSLRGGPDEGGEKAETLEHPSEKSELGELKIPVEAVESPEMTPVAETPESESAAAAVENPPMASLEEGDPASIRAESGPTES